MLPLSYIEPLYRPPSEAYSLILQITNGCSYNECTFCTMYTAPQKKFRPKPVDEIEQEIRWVASRINIPRRIFLADGDALALSVRRLEQVLDLIQQHLPQTNRVSAYCLPRNLSNKSVDELKVLREKGLALVYVGVESGDDEVLQRVQKGETFNSTLDALLKLKAAGIKASVMVLNGLGGRYLSEQHAYNSAKLISAAQPEFLSTLVLTLRPGTERFAEGFNGQFQPLTQLELFQEMELFLQNLELDQTVFRSDHASNYLILKGTLGRDKSRLLDQVRGAIALPADVHLRPEWARGL